MSVTEGDAGADAAKSAAAPEKEEKLKEKMPEATAEKGNGSPAASDTKPASKENDSQPPAVELPPDVRARLKKLDKLEKVYNSMCRLFTTTTR